MQPVVADIVGWLNDVTGGQPAALEGRRGHGRCSPWPGMQVAARRPLLGGSRRLPGVPRWRGEAAPLRRAGDGVPRRPRGGLLPGRPGRAHLADAGPAPLDLRPLVFVVLTAKFTACGLAKTGDKYLPWIGTPCSSPSVPSGRRRGADYVSRGSERCAPTRADPPRRPRPWSGGRPALAAAPRPPAGRPRRPTSSTSSSTPRSHRRASAPPSPGRTTATGPTPSPTAAAPSTPTRRRRSHRQGDVSACPARTTTSAASTRRR